MENMFSSLPVRFFINGKAADQMLHLGHWRTTWVVPQLQSPLTMTASQRQPLAVSDIGILGHHSTWISRKPSRAGYVFLFPRFSLLTRQGMVRRPCPARGRPGSEKTSFRRGGIFLTLNRIHLVSRALAARRFACHVVQQELIEPVEPVRETGRQSPRRRSEMKPRHISLVLTAASCPPVIEIISSLAVRLVAPGRCRSCGD